MPRKNYRSKAQRRDSLFDGVISLARSNKTSGAGQRATLVHSLEIERLNARWGAPLYSTEPISLAIAKAQQAYARLRWRLSLYWPISHPYAEQRIDELGNASSEILDYITDLMPYEVPGIYTEAQTVEEFERLSVPPEPISGRIDYAALKERIDIVDYIGRYVPLRRMGTRFKARCPFHDEKTASFTVYPDTKSFYCFGCMAGGDVIDFAKRQHGNLPEIA